MKDWQPGAIPLISLMHTERRRGKLKPVIKKAMVNLQDKVFQTYASKRDEWLLEESYRNPGNGPLRGLKQAFRNLIRTTGPIQLFGPMADVLNFTVQLETFR